MAMEGEEAVAETGLEEDAVGALPSPILLKFTVRKIQPTILLMWLYMDEADNNRKRGVMASDPKSSLTLASASGNASNPLLLPPPEIPPSPS